MQTLSQFDPRAFRSALGTFTTGVTVITARARDGTPVGITANSFNSVSLDPPMVLWSLAKSSRSLGAFDAAEYWAVHILSAHQDALSNRFAKSGEDKFVGVETEAGVGNTPLLTGCCARLQCKTSFKHEGGDHIIFVGEVVNFDTSDAPPLVFQAGKYAVATRKTEGVSLSRAPVHEVSMSFGADFLGYLLWRSYYQFHTAVREHISSYGLCDVEFFTMVTLLHKDGRTVNNVNALISITGLELTPETINRLNERGLLRTVGDEMSAPLYLTEKGRDTALHILAAAKAIESDCLDKLGYWETVSFKNLLKQFILQTDPGLPHLWEETPPSS